MNAFRQTILFCVILLGSIQSCIAQTSQKGYTKCEALEFFLNDPKVIDNFSRFNPTVIDTFVFVDMDSTLTKCNISTWRGKPLKILTSGNLFDSVMRHSWPYLQVDKRKLYRFAMGKSQLFMQGEGSLISEARYKIKKGKYFVDPISNSVE